MNPIDPKKLTKADLEKQVLVEIGSQVFKGILKGWDKKNLVVKLYKDNLSIGLKVKVPAEACSFLRR